MAIEEITLYNTNGDEINLSNIVNQMINYYVLKLEVGETRVTDFSEGSEIRNILEAFAIGIFALLEEQAENTKISFISTAYGAWLDKIGESPFINLDRVTGDYAHGVVKFTLETAQASDFVIGADTVLLSSSTGLDFITTSDCFIGAGDLTGEATVECLTVGSDGNVLAGSIDTIVDDDDIDTDLVSVTNENRLEEGTDLEDDETYRQRLLDNVRADGFGTIGYYNKLCTDIKGVHDVLFTNAAGYTKNVAVNGYTKPVGDGVILDVLTALTDDRNHVLNHSFSVSKVQSTTVNLAITLSVTDELDTDDLDAMMGALFDGGGMDSIDYEGLYINEPLTRERLINALLMFEAIVDVTSVTSGGNEITTLSPDDGKVLQLGTVSWTQNEV